MEESFLNEDVCFIIAKYCDYRTLMEMEKTNNFLNYVAYRERKKRLKSIYPFGEKKAKIKIILKKDVIIDEIFCILPNKYEILIPLEKYHITCYVNDVLKTWFFYNFSCKDWILTAKIFKSILRIINKPSPKEMGDILIFDFKEGKSFLSEIS
jgi:hypothetical protein